jgi:hypothetical protein
LASSATGGSFATLLLGSCRAAALPPASLSLIASSVPPALPPALAAAPELRAGAGRAEGSEA